MHTWNTVDKSGKISGALAMKDTQIVVKERVKVENEAVK